MSRNTIISTTFLLFAFTGSVLACLWDSDTLQMERLRFPGVLEIITGKFVRHSRAYYEWRIGDRKKKLGTNPGDLALIDDLAVAYAKLGRPEEGISLLEEVLKQHPNRYETLSNLGTLLFFANRLDDSKAYIRRALEINPDAHFGREKYQLLLTEYLQQSDYEKLGVMSTGSREPKEVGTSSLGFAGFLAHKDRNFELKKATTGVLGMMHFADFESPILLEALGDLLLNGSTDDDAAQLACRAYLRASKSTSDAAVAQRFRRMAEQSLAMHLPPTQLDGIERNVREEVEEAEAWFSEIELNEQRWIAENRDVDLVFAAKYYDSLEHTIEAAAQAAKLQLPMPSDAIPLENTWATPLVGIILAIGLIAFVVYFQVKLRAHSFKSS
jgi:hypothetical protein